MKTLGKIIVGLVAFLCIGATYGIINGSTKLNPDDVIPVIAIYTLVIVFCIWAYIKMSKKND